MSLEVLNSRGTVGGRSFPPPLLLSWPSCEAAKGAVLHSSSRTPVLCLLIIGLKQ